MNWNLLGEKMNIGNSLVMCRKEGNQNGDLAAYIAFEIQLVSTRAVVLGGSRHSPLY